MTCEDYDYDGYQKYDDKLARNIKYGESWSTKVVNGVEVKRQVPPDIKCLPDVFITAEDAQIIRNRLNEVYGNNPKIGYRNKLNEIIIIFNSFWRTEVFQFHLWITGQSTTNQSDHEEGTAVDIANPRGMNSWTLYRFIKNKCNTRFNWFKRYYWGIHCSRR